MIEPRVFGDERGFFLESWNAHSFSDIGIDAQFVQDNHSRSARGVLRGLHYQILKPQAKLLRVIAGEIFDVVVDIRKRSPTFGKYVTLKLDSKRIYTSRCVDISTHNRIWRTKSTGLIFVKK